MIQKPTSDAIIDEIHRTRRDMSEKFGGDFRLMLDDARRRQAAAGRPVWQPNATNKAMHPSSGNVATGNDESTPAAG